MTEVRYISDEDLKRIRELFTYRNVPVMLNLLNMGANMTLCISDLLNLKFEDIKSDNTVFVKEKKTQKGKIIKLNKTCQQAVKDLKKFYKKSGYKNYSKGYLFKSQHHMNKAYFKDVPMTPYSAGRYLREAKDLLSITYPIGTHSFRKTWGYNVYTKTKDIALVMKAFNHSSPSVTLRYIGIEQETLNATYDSIEI